jgi:hypothetical protein
VLFSNIAKVLNDYIIKEVCVGRLKLDIVRIILFSAAFCFASSGLSQAAAEPNLKSDEQSPQQKADTLREVAQNWIQVGLEQYKRGLYAEAEKSFLAASEYQQYLTDKEVKQLEETIAKTHQAGVERQAALEQINQTQDLLSKGQTLEAKARYEKLRSSPYITEQQRKQISEQLITIEMSLDRQKEKITDLYNRSVELYKKGNLEEARNGFVEVAKYGLLVTPKGKSPEDYLVLIDKTLTDRLKSGLSAESKPTPTPPAETEKTPTAPQKSETQLSQPSPEPQPSEKPYLEEQPPSSQELAEVAAPAEPTAQAQQPEATTPEAAPVDEAKAKIVRSYTKAVVEDTAVKVGFYIGKGELDKAVNAVRSASDVVSENRPLLGDELFTQYTIRLKRLADRIIQARKSS